MPRNFHSLFGQTFSETTGTANENGLYMGLEVRPAKNWRFVAYADTWQHQWLRFKANAPSKGSEYYARITFFKRKDLEHLTQKLNLKSEIRWKWAFRYQWLIKN